jgi:hypothetical protein
MGFRHLPKHIVCEIRYIINEWDETVAEMKYCSYSKYPKIDSIIYSAKKLISSSLCVIKGHNWHENGCDAENGTSDIYCSRCGRSETFWMR